MSDEGGAFSHSIEEVLLWVNNLLIYYKKTYGSWDQFIGKIRVYAE